MLKECALREVEENPGPMPRLPRLPDLRLPKLLIRVVLVRGPMRWLRQQLLLSSRWRPPLAI